MRGRIPLTVLAAATLAVLAAGPAAAADKDCDDFTTQQRAQVYFEGKGGSSANNVDRLDNDHDGIACEALPGGANTGGGRTGAGGETGGQAGQGELPFTGPGDTWLAAAGALLLAAGGWLLWRLRYRPSH